MDYQMIQWVFSGIGVFFIPIILKSIFVPHPIINITLEEKSFLSGHHRAMRRLFFECYGMLAICYVSIIGTSIDTEAHPITDQFPFVENSNLPTSLILFFEIVALMIFIFLFSVSLFKKSLRKVFKNNNKRKTRKAYIWFFTISFVYFLILLYTFGYMINLFLNLLNTKLQLNKETTMEVIFYMPTSLSMFGLSIIVLVFYLLLRFLLFPMISIIQFIFTPDITATITLNNGTILSNKYILRPSIDGNILIGDKPNISDGCNKTMLAKQTIVRVDFNWNQDSIEMDAAHNDSEHTITNNVFTSSQCESTKPLPSKSLLDEEIDKILNKKSILLPPDYKK
ncbi:hypothetical protein [Paenibacillus oleatilyticus]|uniref:Uncharacterized protein n=1 Tax=Paenibacillus oleatilyticus TaxID=2594886 RepID=A0ABV4V6B4_9BACL